MEVIKADLVIMGEGDRFAVAAEDGPGIAAVGHDELVGGQKSNYSGGSDRVALRGLKFTPTTGLL